MHAPMRDDRLKSGGRGVDDPRIARVKSEPELKAASVVSRAVAEVEPEKVDVRVSHKHMFPTAGGRARRALSARLDSP